MKTLEEVINKIKEVDEAFPGESNRDMRNSLKIDLFFDVPDKIFCEALRLTEVESNDFTAIQYARHTERKQNQRLYTYNIEYSKKRNVNDIVALLYDQDKDELRYVCVEIGNKELLEKYLIKSNGQAISYVPEKGCEYWLLQSSVNSNFLLFRQNKTRRFTDIDNSELDLAQAKYLAK